MKVAFIYPVCQPTDGGVYTFCQTVGAQLKAAKTEHEFRFVRYGAPIEDADFVWFLTPHYMPVKKPFAVTVWDLAHRLMPWFPEVSESGWNFEQREAFYSSVLPRAAVVMVGSRTLQTRVNEFYHVPTQRIFVNRLPVPTHLDEVTAIDPPYPKPYVLYPACFWPHKNHVMILDALRLLKAQGTHYSAVFPGADKGNLAYIKECAEGLDVHFPGFVSAGELKGLYQNAHALTFASMMGPDNLPPLEAISLNCPVLCYGYEGADEQLWDAATYFWSAEDLAREIVKAKSLPHRLYETNYAEKIVEALGYFAPLRKLWGKEYVHS